MKKLFAFVCHEITSPLEFTVKYLSQDENSIILIHVDKKANISDFFHLKRDNVIFVEERINVTWGGVSQIDATLSLLRNSLAYDYDYFFLLSGSCIMIKPLEDLDKFLQDNKGKEFIHYQDDRDVYIDPVERVKYVYPNCFYSNRRSFIDKIKCKFFYFIKDVFFLNPLYKKVTSPTLYKGTNWFCLTKNSVNYILDYIKDNISVYKMFDKSFCADEVFFHSILATKPDLNKYINKELQCDALRYVDWSKGPDYPRTLDITDFKAMRDSGAFFARKIRKDETLEFMSKFLNR